MTPTQWVLIGFTVAITISIAFLVLSFSAQVLLLMGRAIPRF